MYVVKSIGVLSVAKIMGLIYGCLGLIFAPMFLVLGLIGSIAGQAKSPFAGVFGIVFAVFVPVVYGLMGFVIGALGGLLYNLFAKLVGGIELDLAQHPAGPLAPYPIIPPATPSI